MKKYYLIAGFVILACSAYASANSLFSSNHHSHDNIGHAAVTDRNGCHDGPTGFHCHR